MMKKILKNSFLVGGAVRDTLLGLTPKDRDYVVVGCTPDEMLQAGFKQVGNDFPVFLHPETGEEYALARTEHRTGTGHTDFFTFHGPDVTLEQDLKRRDLTINSMALKDGGLIDPFSGLFDLKSKILRHTSTAFSEDPLRVLRIARFAAQLDFDISMETAELCSQVSFTVGFREITQERVFKELEKSLMGKKPSNFFRALKNMNVSFVHFPEVWKLVGQTQPEQWHPEGDAFEHTMQVLDQSALLSNDPKVRFAALVHDFGKGLTRKEDLPKHKGHEAAGVPVVDRFCKRLRAPTVWRKHALIATEFHMHVHKTQILNPKTFVKVFEKTGAGRDFSVIETLTTVSKADVRGRGVESQTETLVNQMEFCLIMRVLTNVKFEHLNFKYTNPKPDAIKQAFVKKRIEAVKVWRSYNPPRAEHLPAISK